jgi:twinkle protein
MEHIYFTDGKNSMMENDNEYEITHQPCPFKDCGSSDAFSYNTQKMTGFCFACDRGYPRSGMKLTEWARDTYPLQEREGQAMSVVPTPTELLTAETRPYRGIREDTMNFFGVQTLVGQDGEAKKQAYIYPSGGRKIRTMPKAFHTEAGFRGDELFGMGKFNAGSSRVVVVTEGEVDTLSAFQMLEKKYPVVSLPSASPSKKLWQGEAKDWLDSFEKIILSVDNDDAGNGIADKIAGLFPNKTYRIPHDKYKDANEFLEAGAGQAYRSAFYNAKKYTPQNVWNTPEQFLGILHEEDDATYLPTGISAFDEVALGLMQGHLTVFQAPEGIGKTEFMRYLEYHFLSKHTDVPIAICHLEETKKRGLLGLVSYKLSKNLTRKDLIDEADMAEEVDQALIELTEKENLYQFTIGVDEDPMEILNRIRYFSQACGVKYVFFEPIQDLAYSRQTDESIEKWLSALSVQLSRMSAELNVGIVTIAHENDDGQIRDCRTIGKRASVVVKLERDKMSEDDEDRNTTKLLVTKNRPAGTTGHAGSLSFDSDSFTLKEKFDRFA